jgi:DNA topoisomerase-3
VSDLTSERIREPPPLPFDLSTLQQTASSSLGFDVQHTLALAQSLYETHKAITYPRSDCRYLPTNMHGEARSIITSLLNADSGLNSGCAELDYQKRSRAWNDANITAHHAIIPTSDVPLRQRLNADEWALYHLIRSAYVAQFLPDHEYDRTRIDLAAGDVALRARGRKVLIAGWRNVFALPGDSAPAAEDEPEPQVLPALPIGSVCTIERAAIHARKTVPPCPFTQGELIKAMKGIARWVSDPALKAKLKDTTGIGTEATRAHIISTLISRGFLRKHGRAVQTTEIAHTLLRAIPAAVADPATTALWEQALDRIASNQLSLDHFVHQQSSWVADIVAQHREQAWAVSGGPGIRPPPVTAQARAKKKQSSARSRVNGSTRRNG